MKAHLKARRKIVKNGTCIAINFPKNLMKQVYNWNIGDYVSIEYGLDNKSIILKKMDMLEKLIF
jgi:antitoxin component of MazEF toxin-antitoxin module